MQNCAYRQGDVNTSQTHDDTHPCRHVTSPIKLQSTPYLSPSGVVIMINAISSDKKLQLHFLLSQQAMPRFINYDKSKICKQT